MGYIKYWFFSSTTSYIFENDNIDSPQKIKKLMLWNRTLLKINSYIVFRTNTCIPKVPTRCISRRWSSKHEMWASIVTQSLYACQEKLKVYALTNEEQCPGKFKRRRRKKMLQTNKHFVTAGHTKASTLFRNWKSTVLLSMRKLIQQGWISRYKRTFYPHEKYKVT